LIFSGSPPHRRQIDDRRDAGEVLHHYSGRGERDLHRRCRVRIPAGQRLDIRCPDRLAVLVAEQVLKQDLQRERQSRDVELRLERVKPVDLVRRIPDAQGGSGIKAVSDGGRHFRSWLSDFQVGHLL
jgi:hypothetical protein